VIRTTGQVAAGGVVPDENLGPVDVTIIGPDLRISIVACNVPTATVGSDAHYSVVLRNASAAEGAVGVTALIPPPALTNVQTGSIDGGAWWDNANGRVVWQGSLPPVGEHTFGFDVTAAISGTTNTSATLTYGGYGLQVSSPDLDIYDQGGAPPDDDDAPRLPLIMKNAQ
jgi:hypothetical protein